MKHSFHILCYTLKHSQNTEGRFCRVLCANTGEHPCPSRAHRRHEQFLFTLTVPSCHSGDAMTYTFLNIKDYFASIGKADGGWEPFKQTFAYFNSLAHSQAPKDELEMLNLFLSKLQDFSGVNVFSTSLLPASARNLYESYYGGPIQYITMAVPSSITVSPSNTTIKVGGTVNLTGSVLPVSASQSLTWMSRNENIATVSSAGVIMGIREGTTVITVKSSVDSSKTAMCTVTVEPLLIYQTRYEEGKWFGGIDEENVTIESFRPDILYNDMTQSKIVSDTKIKDKDFTSYNSVSSRKDEFINMATKTFLGDILFGFANRDPAKSIIIDMTEHFVGESNINFAEPINVQTTNKSAEYDVYKNPKLTALVEAQNASTVYVKGMKNALDSSLKLNTVTGNLYALKYDSSKRFNYAERRNQPFITQINVNEPVFDKDGLKICINGLQGNKIEILSYYRTGNNYNGTMRVTYYDHFGLGADDIDKFDQSGFKQWFVLQHWNGLNASPQPKPFITTIEFVVTFSGTF